MSDNTSVLTRYAGLRERRASPAAPVIASEPVEMPENSSDKAYSAVATDRGPVLALVLWLAQADAQGHLVWVLPYADLLSIAGKPGELTLHYGRRVVTLRGTHLLGKFLDALAEHRVVWIRERQAGAGESAGQEVCIDVITIADQP